MAGPIHLNQVLYQTPTVEKIQQAEIAGQDQAQRHASMEELKQTRERTETVQKADKSEQSRVAENDRKEREDRRKKRREARRTRTADNTDLEEQNRKPTGAGGLVDIII
jgi:hypothetical protein